MKSTSSSSCIGTSILLILGLFLIRFLAPEIWAVLLLITKGALGIAFLLVLAVLIGIGYFTYKNYKSNEQKQAQKDLSRIDRTESLYESVVNRLHSDVALNEVSADELLQSEILIKDKLPEIKLELIRLKDFASGKNLQILSKQTREYEVQLKEARDPSVKQVIQENLKMLEDKKQRMDSASEEIRQKEASIDLIYHSLLNVDESLKFGRPVKKLFPSDLYSRFGVTPPAEREQLPPLGDVSSTTKT